MKVVLTGGTGFAGAVVLTQLVARPEVTAVTCLSRRALAVTSPKVETILHADFAAYDDALAAKLADHVGCVWALGGKSSDTADADEFLRATYTFTMRFAQAVAAQLTRPFRFCYSSGMGADSTESAWLRWERTTRHLKGRVERHLAELTESNPLFRATAFRPAGILPETSSRIAGRLLAPIAVRVDRLAKAMIDEVLGDAQPRFRVISNAQIRRLGRAPT